MSKNIRKNRPLQNQPSVAGGGLIKPPDQMSTPFFEKLERAMNVSDETKRRHPTDPYPAASGRQFKVLADQKPSTQLSHPTLPNHSSVAGGGLIKPPDQMSTPFFEKSKRAVKVSNETKKAPPNRP